MAPRCKKRGLPPIIPGLWKSVFFIAYFWKYDQVGDHYMTSILRRQWHFCSIFYLMCVFVWVPSLGEVGWCRRGRWGCSGVQLLELVIPGLVCGQAGSRCLGLWFCCVPLRCLSLGWDWKWWLPLVHTQPKLGILVFPGRCSWGGFTSASLAQSWLATGVRKKARGFYRTRPPRGVVV